MEEFENCLKTNYPLMFNGDDIGLWVGEGWQPIIRQLCSAIQVHIDSRNSHREYLLKKNPDGENIPDKVEQVVVAQIKEKFGELRFYYDGGDDYISGLVSMAESMSRITCEECGKPGTLGGKYWMKTLCPEHRDLQNQRDIARSN